MKTKITSAVGFRFYPGILLGVKTENEEDHYADEGDRELTMLTTSHELYIPFASLFFSTTYLIGEEKIIEEAIEHINNYEE